jgi:hypothetical protein
MKQYISWGYGKYEERNAGIFEAVLKGRTYRDVAQENGLSRERISQIVGRYCRKAANMLFAQTQRGERVTIRWLRKNEDAFTKCSPPNLQMHLPQVGQA